MRLRRYVPVVALFALVAVMVACGGSPTAPSGQAGVVLSGNVLGVAGVATRSVGNATAAAETITVTVQENPAITTTVGADGSFTLRGLPEGGFTLVFTSGGTTLGTLSFGEVKPNQQITITVKVDSGTVTLLEEKRNGIGHGDVEVEGVVEAVVTLSETADSTFTIDGHTVIARPGQTAIREGNRGRTVNDVTVGRHVHVKGVWTDPAAGSTTQQVLASEIKLQGDSSDDGDDDGGGGTKTCMINGGTVGAGIELEGSMDSGSASAFMMRVQGNRASGLVSINASGAQFKCNGKPSGNDCKSTLHAGSKVHVSGDLATCTTSSASVNASQVMIQK